MRAIKYLMRCILGDYALYRIYELDIITETVRKPNSYYTFRVLNDGTELKKASNGVIRNLAGYSGDEAYGFALYDATAPICVCWFWYGNQYRKRNFWPLEKQDAKLVQIATDPSYRGRGLASILIRQASVVMQTHGFKRLYARIWHSNGPSISAFDSAGWRYIAFVLEIFPFGRKPAYRFEYRIKATKSEC